MWQIFLIIMKFLMKSADGQKSGDFISNTIDANLFKYNSFHKTFILFRKLLALILIEC